MFEKHYYSYFIMHIINLQSNILISIFLKEALLVNTKVRKENTFSLS